MAWLYFVVRYYQHFHDISDRGILTTYRDRLYRLARRRAENRAAKYLPLDLADLAGKPQIRIEIRTLALMVSEPPPWTYELSGKAHIDERPPGTKGRMQIIEPTRFTLPYWELLIPKIRAGWWVVVQTRLVTEYGLPFLVAAAPVGFAVVAWFRRQAAV